MEGKQVARLGLTAVLAAASVAGLYNVFADNAAVRELAKRTACDGTSCDAQMTREGKTPIGQSFTFQRPSGSVDISCRRAFYLLGEYACEKQ